MGDSEGGGTRYNLRSPSVKRLMQESKELREATEQYHAQPLDDNLYEWHFTIRGAPDTDFADGVSNSGLRSEGVGKIFELAESILILDCEGIFR